jgi:hypothetical protein
MESLKWELLMVRLFFAVFNNKTGLVDLFALERENMSSINKKTKTQTITIGWKDGVKVSGGRECPTRVEVKRQVSYRTDGYVGSSRPGEWVKVVENPYCGREAKDVDPNNPLSELHTMPTEKLTLNRGYLQS